MDSPALITAFVTLFVIIDPIGLMPLFVALTQGVPAHKRRAIALRACITAFSVLALFAFLGEAVLGHGILWSERCVEWSIRRRSRT